MFDETEQPEADAEPDEATEQDAAVTAPPIAARAGVPVPPRRGTAPTPQHRAAAKGEIEFFNLASDIALGRARVVLLAGVSDGRDAAVAADALVRDALAKGLSVCRVDAGSAHPTSEMGLTDLCAEQASYGDIVHKVRSGLAEVPWGQLAALDRRSMRPLTLLEALADIYELVVVATGRVGMNSTLPLFAGSRRAS